MTVADKTVLGDTVHLRHAALTATLGLAAAVDVPLALAIVGLGVLIVIAPSSVPGLTPSL